MECSSKFEDDAHRLFKLIDFSGRGYRTYDIVVNNGRAVFELSALDQMFEEILDEIYGADT